MVTVEVLVQGGGDPGVSYRTWRRTLHSWKTEQTLNHTPEVSTRAESDTFGYFSDDLPAMILFKVLQCDFLSLTVGAVVQTPASTPTIGIGVVVQSHAAGAGDNHTWTPVATQLIGLLIRNGHLQRWRCVIGVFFFIYLSLPVGCSTHHLQPVVETLRALFGVDALDVKAVAEVQGDGEAIGYRNDVATGQGLLFQIRVSRTGQVAFWLIE